MKRITIFLMLSLLALLLCNTNSIADTTYTFADEYINWPGYEYLGHGDEIGTPLVGKMTVNTTSDSDLEYLKSITIEVTQRRVNDYLFINTTGAWDTWEYLIEGQVKYPTTTGFAMWEVPDPKNYTYKIVNHSGARNGHPYSIDDLVTTVGYLASMNYDDSILEYTFNNNKILLSDGWTIGYSPWCANDVTLGGNVPVPATLLLFGSGLIGLLGVRRRRFLKRA